MYNIMAKTAYGWEVVDNANDVAEKKYLLREYRLANPGTQFKAVRQ